MSNLKTIVRGAYDIQKLRIQMGNRIVSNFKVKIGQEPGKSEDEMDAKGKKILKDIRLHYRKLTDAVTTKLKPADLKIHEGIISDYTEYVLVTQYLDLERDEASHFSMLRTILKDYPISEYLQSVTGVGPAIAGVIISEFDIHKAKYPSSLHKYAGLDVCSDGRGRSRRKEHLVEIEYKDAAGKTQIKLGITFSPFLKTKLIAVLGPSFLRAGPDNTYSKIYYNYRHRLENHATYKDVSKGHRHNMAIRYMVKQFLVDLHPVWRKLEGLPVSQPYHEAKLGIRHSA